MNALQKIQEEEGPEPTDDEDVDSTTSGNAISRAFEKVLDLPGVSLLKPSLGSLIPLLAGSIPIALAAVAIPAALLLVLLSSLFGGKKASSVVRLKAGLLIHNSELLLLLVELFALRLCHVRHCTTASWQGSVITSSHEVASQMRPCTEDAKCAC